MIRRLALAAALFVFVSGARGDDALPATVVDTVKRATVFIRVEGDGWSATGSGFVVSGDEKVLLIATNHHVAFPTPSARPGGKSPTITVVFDSGTRTERSFPATVAGADADWDLAVLRVVGVKTPPRAIPLADATKPTETTSVYSFGFPFGEALSSNKGSPAVTVGKASVSSLRNGPDGELAAIQIDGNLNPGNSGGPVVDAKGRLVGVAQSIIKEGQGIGFIVPAGELGQMMRGRAGSVRLLPPKTADGRTTARLEVGLIDPAGSVKAMSARYVVVRPTDRRPVGDSLARHPGVKTVDLKVENGVGVADLLLPATEGEVLVQVLVDSKGQQASTGVKSLSLAVAALSGDVLGPPKAGWKEYTPLDRSFVMWVPEKPLRQSSRDRTLTVNGRLIRISAVAGQTADGLEYEGQSIFLPLALARVPVEDLYDLIGEVVADDLKGKVTEVKPVEFGKQKGVEMTVTAGKTLARVRVSASPLGVFVVIASGSAAQVSGTEAEILLAAFRPGFGGGLAPVPGTGPGPAPVTITGGKGGPTVAGGNGPPPFGGAPFFKDVGPSGSLLVGVEVVLGRPYFDELILSVRPLYRLGVKEATGKQFGTTVENAVTLKAKAGYAVGGITAKARNVCDGFSLTFMKVKDGKLDPTDSYESQWVGWNGGVAAIKVVSDGTPVIGLTGRANDKDVTGVGLVFKGQEKVDPAAAPIALPPGAKKPTILGGAFDQEFAELAPNGGLLVGFEIGVAPSFGRTMTRAARPIYRVNGKEVFGEQRGTQLGDVTTIKAKAGYAVGAVSVMHGLGFDGLSVTFMKVTDGKLDPTDSYESPYLGSDERKALTKLGGDGTPVVGVVGKTNAKDLTGFGLLFKGQEGFVKK